MDASQQQCRRVAASSTSTVEVTTVHMYVHTAVTPVLYVLLHAVGTISARGDLAKEQKDG
jgi:hypothetical protein